MTEREQKLTAALAAADQEFALADNSLDKAVEDARRLIHTHGTTGAWAVLGSQIAKELGCTTKHQKFAVAMLAAAAIRLVQNS